MRRSLIASVLLSLLLVSAAAAQEESDECRRWSVEVQNSERYDLSVYSFRGERVPPKVYQSERGRLRGRFLKRVTARSNETLELPAGESLIWIEPVGSEHELRDRGWSESSAIVASPTRRTRLTQVRIRAEYTCLDEPG
jgi:hypothetical protein